MHSCMWDDLEGGATFRLPDNKSLPESLTTEWKASCWLPVAFGTPGGVEIQTHRAKRGKDEEESSRKWKKEWT